MCGDNYRARRARCGWRYQAFAWSLVTCVRERVHIRVRMHIYTRTYRIAFERVTRGEGERQGTFWYLVRRVCGGGNSGGGWRGGAGGGGRGERKKREVAEGYEREMQGVGWRRELVGGKERRDEWRKERRERDERVETEDSSESMVNL